MIIIDGFAGPGRYSGGEIGSPLIALDVANGHIRNLKNCQVSFVFIEEDPARVASLSQLTSAIELPSTFNSRIINGTFADKMGMILDEVERGGSRLAPTFVMVDPFGFEGVPMSLMARIIAHPRSELLISFMYEPVNRWLSDIRNERNFDNLFGCTQWREARQFSSPQQRREFLLSLYIDQLKLNRLQYIRSFEMRDSGNRTEYFLVFGTNHLEGLKVMKEAMWKVDPSGRFMFSDATNPAQLTLFQPEPDYNQLKRLLLEKFAGQREVHVEEIERFVLTETPFRETHYKIPILRPMEQAREVQVIGASTHRRRGSYPDGTVLRFLAASEGR